MTNSEAQHKSKRLIELIREIKRSMDDIIAYLKTLGIEKATPNTLLEPETVAKVYSHFRKDIEAQDKHKKKIKDFILKHDVDISEAQEIKQKEEKERKKKEEEKRKKEEELRLKKMVEEEHRIREEEKKKQELIAIKAREKELKEEEEKIRKKKEAERAEKRKKQEAAIKQKTEQKTKEKTEEEKHKKPFKKEEKVKAEEDKHKKVHTERAHVKPTPKPVAKRGVDFKVSPVSTDKKPFIKEPVSKKPDKKKLEKKPEKGKIRGTFQKTPIERIKKEEEREEKIEKKKILTAKHTEVLKGKEKFIKADIDFTDRRKKAKQIKSHREKEIAQKEIDEAIRETIAGLREEMTTSARKLERKRKKKERLEQKKIQEEIAESRKNIISVTEFVSTAELAALMSIEPSEIIKKCLELGMLVSINQRLDKNLIELLTNEFGYKIDLQTEYEEDILKDKPDTEETLQERSPVVTVMGHVDHGKTSLLDYIRKSNVVAGEAGGITQHIGAYKVKLENGKSITFLDTPGHEAFTAMRARGGQAADIVVLVVAADDSVMPQTIEAINHALAANVPIVIAINKIDKQTANPQKIKQQLADKNILVEEWGGKYQHAEISAKQGINIDILLEKILLEAEILELKANPKKNARGVVLEAKLDKGRGIVATVLVQKGTLKIGDTFVAGIYNGKVKAMFDEREHRIEKALPSDAVQILGFDGLPQAGDTFVVLKSEREAKEIANKRQQLKREQDFRQIKHMTLDDISRQIKEGKQVDLNVIIKADTDGSAEALADSLHKLATQEVKVRVFHKAVGQITESDVLLAEASKAIIIGFNVRPNLNARKLAEKNVIDIRLYNIIYNVIDEIKQALEGLLQPERKEEITATVEVRQVFKVPKIGNVAGCYVQDGKITRNSKIRLLREGLVIFEGQISSLKRLKDDVREVESGYECGIGLENFNDVKIGDVIEAYRIVEIKRKLILN